MKHHAVDHIISTIGSEVIEQALDVSSHSVRAAKTKRQFPANWYWPLKSLCEETGIPCPGSAFNWRGRKTKDGNAHRPVGPAGENQKSDHGAAA